MEIAIIAKMKKKRKTRTMTVATVRAISRSSWSTPFFAAGFFNTKFMTA